MTPRKPIRNFIRRLRRDQRGAVALTFLLSSTVLLGGSFGAIDLIRYNVAQNRLQNALDSAAISAGRNLANRTPTPGTPEAEAWVNDARNFFSSNMPSGYLGSSVHNDDLVVNYREETSGMYITGQFVEMSARGDLPLISTGYFKITAFDLVASNEAVRRTRNDLEVVMALDNSGSMDFDSPTRMSVLKTAAKDLTSTILGASSVPGGSQRVFVGLVPFTDVVNVRDYALNGNWLTYPDEQDNYVRNLWSGCIVEPDGNWSNTNRLPAQALTPGAGFQPLHLTYSYDMTPSNLGSGRLVPHTSANPNPVAYNGRGVNRDRRISAVRQSNTQFRVNFAVDADYCLSGRARFLNNQEAAMETAINNMVSYGGTGVPVGLLWAWRMLHPSWRGAWGDAEMPRDPEPGTLSKVIVLLSDGENAPVYDGRRQALGNANNNRRSEYQLRYRYYACRSTNWFGNCTAWQTAVSEQTSNEGLTADTHSGTRGQCPSAGLRMANPLTTVPNDYDRTANQCNNSGSSIGYGNSNIQSTAAYDAYMAQLCTNVKEDGNEIKIYTVTLGSDVPASARTLMRNCASGPSFYYNAQNVSDLPQVFASIAGALTELRLTH